MAKSDSFFLGARGQVFGPFTADAISEMKSSGKISQYTYIWDEKEEAWTNLDPQPPRPKKDSIRVNVSSDWEAVYFGAGRILSGDLKNVSPEGCELVTEHRTGMPEMGARGFWTLNVRDRSTRRVVNIKAEVSAAYREKGKWVYRLSWKNLPQL